MEILFELLFEVLFEGLIEVTEKAKMPRFIRVLILSILFLCPALLCIGFAIYIWTKVLAVGIIFLFLAMLLGFVYCKYMIKIHKRLAFLKELSIVDVEDFANVRDLIASTFGTAFLPKGRENASKVVQNTRGYVSELERAAVYHGKTVGYIMLVEGTIGQKDATKKDVVQVALHCVADEYRNKSIGRLLLKDVENRAKNLHYSIIFTTAAPSYYRGRGYFSAEKRGFYNSGLTEKSDFLCKELKKGSFKNRTGTVNFPQFYDKVDNNT